MRKILLSLLTLICAIVIGLGFYVHQKPPTMSDLMLENLEALAQVLPEGIYDGEGGGGGNQKCWSKTIWYPGKEVRACSNCTLYPNYEPTPDAKEGTC